MVQERSHKEILAELRKDLSSDRADEIQYGMKEFIQGVLIGFILGFVIAAQLVV